MWNIISNNAVTVKYYICMKLVQVPIDTPYKIHNFRYTLPGECKIVVDGTKLTDGLNIASIDPQTGVSAIIYR